MVLQESAWNEVCAALKRSHSGTVPDQASPATCFCRSCRGQASVLQRISGSERAIAGIVTAISEMGQAEDVHRMRTIEGKAALAYWRAWEHVTVPWVRRDEPRVPEHWRTLGARMSPLSLKPRYGVNPPNAILNYLYSVFEAETRDGACSADE
jgi:CRISPR associated protein Cas1